VRGWIANGGPCPVATFEAIDEGELLRKREQSVSEYVEGCEEPTTSLGAFRPSSQNAASKEAGPRVRPGEAWHVVSRTSRRLRRNEDAKQVQRIILAGVVMFFTLAVLIFQLILDIIVVHGTNRSIQMTQPRDLGTAPRFRLEVSTTRSESIAMVVEGPLEDLSRRAPFSHEPPAATASLGLSRLPMSRSHESSRKLLGRRSQ